MLAKCQSLAQCLGSNQTFNLWVETADHTIKSSPVLVRSSEEGPQLFIQSSPTESQSTLRLRTADDETILLVDQPSEDRSSESEPARLKLQGPSGRGIYELGAGVNMKPYGFGSTIMYQGWRGSKNGDGQVTLVFGEDWIGFEWVAVPDNGAHGEANDEWALWWREPCSANEGCFKGEVVVNVFRSMVAVLPSETDGDDQFKGLGKQGG
ncbi:hypothetical protein NLU13_6003 [Sarocladium strictum]|uniref:Uncharacterized protein n=1 Tax=Sarocladium strictum TaxID=5046 RepID=A0AA39GFE9_SARSR|nr:hypothetical protein NLU13_6003 [Sarocladium strictum]